MIALQIATQPHTLLLNSVNVCEISTSIQSNAFQHSMSQESLRSLLT